MKNIRALSLKKERDAQSLFVAEGEKLVKELLPFFTCRLLLVTRDWIDAKSILKNADYELITLEEMKKISSLKTPTSVLAIFEKPIMKLDISNLKQELILILDEVQNPGNLGTIVRIADWFGIRHIICSLNTADVYSAKTIQATMGALARVHVHYVDLISFLQSYSRLNLPIYGTFLDGENLYGTALSRVGAIVLGNEGNGISDEVAKYVSFRIVIPSYPLHVQTSESLNVAVATAVVCAEFRRLAE
ncbi:MAG TPA: RNA methyltransferase [Salinivirgaceae bacterium]|nr:RNA methyltransferase [Salinivirgaceae bacterium]HRS67617.1 RNA methyltransferase [Paludibacteraceae bacterium]